MTVAALRLPFAARFVPRGFYYGWVIAGACALLMFVGAGVGYYGLPIFLTPLRDAHGWSTTEVSWASTIYFCVAGLTAAVIGPIIDRRGPRAFMAAGMVINGVSAAAIGLVDSLWQLYAVYFVFAMAFGLSSSVAVNVIMTRWFIRKRALAMSLSSTGVSLSGVVMAPLASKLIDVGGLELATPVLGCLVLAVGLPVVLLVVAWDPASMGLTPDNDPAGGATGVVPAAYRREVQMRTWTSIEAMRTVAFWAILVSFLCVLVAQTGFIVHQVSFLEDRLGSRNAAAFTISVTAVGSIVARLAVGIFADNVDKRLLTVILFVVQGACIALVVQTGNVPATWVITLVFGFTIGNVYMMQSLLVGEIFGLVSFGAVFGLITMAGQVGSGLGPIGVGFLHDQSGGYGMPFMVLAALDCLAAVVVLFARPGKAFSEAPAAHGPVPRTELGAEVE